MNLTSELLTTLATRLSDPDNKQFTAAYLLNELNIAQQEIINELRPEYYDSIATKDELILFDGNGEYALPGSVRGGITGVKKVYIYAFDYYLNTQTKHVARSLSDLEVNKILQNGYYDGTEKEPRYNIMGGKLKMYASDAIAKFYSDLVSVGQTYIDGGAFEALAEGGVLSITDDAYNGFYIVAKVSGNEYGVSDYVGATRKFTVPAIDPADVGELEWYLKTPYKNNYCGAGLLTYVKQPADMTTVALNECELNEAIIPAMLYLAESAIWGSDGKDTRSVVKYNKAMKQVEKLNAKVMPTDNVGCRARKD